ncbi:MAG: hypothetical protein N4A74_11185 [Carboxylicivirga sp.]|jgi:hypothetical protein|nr:hypothetical protein [Carboxylicivirga sp.]
MKARKVKISDIHTASGKVYGINGLITKGKQYMDRDYTFGYIPDELQGCTHILTCGDDKLIDEKDLCLTFSVDTPVEVNILFADKFPIIPKWLNDFERMRLNVTRNDSDPGNLKGYFSIYRKKFSKGTIQLFGCSPSYFLEQDWFVESLGYTYCMYTVVLKVCN